MLLQTHLPNSFIAIFFYSIFLWSSCDHKNKHFDVRRWPLRLRSDDIKTQGTNKILMQNTLIFYFLFFAHAHGFLLNPFAVYL